MPRLGFLTLLVWLASCSLASAQAKLDYKQRQALKDAEYYLDEADGVTQAIAAEVAKMTVGDSTVPMRMVQTCLNSRDEVVKKVGYANDRFKQLPMDNPDVVEQASRIKAIKESLVASEAKLLQVQAGLNKVIDQGGTSAFEADLERLKEMQTRFGNDQVFETQPDVAAELVVLMAPLKAEQATIRQKYADLLNQRTPASQEMQGVLNNFDAVFGRFETAANRYQQDAPQRITQNIAEALADGKKAADGQMPAWFKPTGGVAQKLGWAESTLKILRGLDPQGTATLAAEKQLAAARAEVSQMQESLIQGIIEANRPPADQYNGPDKADLLERVKIKWASANVAGEVLMAGINSDGWQRKTSWEWNTSSWYKRDTSWIQGFVVVKAADEIAHVHYIDITKDHMKQDKLFDSHYEDPAAEPEPAHRVLLKNLR